MIKKYAYLVSDASRFGTFLERTVKSCIGTVYKSRYKVKRKCEERKNDNNAKDFWR
jgi:hypothetical protein